MVRRGAAVVLVAVLLLLGVGALAVRHLERNHVEQFGGVAVAIEGRDFDLWPFNADLQAGVGVGGRLGLVNGRCVGFVHDPDRPVTSSEETGEPIPPADGSGTVIVWPHGVEISGSGNDLRIQSQGRSVRIGDRIEGGNTFGHDLSGIRERLPRECRDSKLLRVGLSE